MPKHPNTVKLRELMARYGIDGPFVSNLLDRSLKTVHCWRAQSPAPISTAMLDLLELKLAQHFGKTEICEKAERYMEGRADYLDTWIGDPKMMAASAAGLLGAQRALRELGLITNDRAAYYATAALDFAEMAGTDLPSAFVSVCTWPGFEGARKNG